MSNFTRHKFFDLFTYLFFKDNDINVNIPNFCPPVYLELYSQYVHRYIKYNNIGGDEEIYS